MGRGGVSWGGSSGICRGELDEQERVGWAGMSRMDRKMGIEEREGGWGRQGVKS